MNLQKISLPEIHGSSNKTSTILGYLPGHLHHLGFLRNPLHHLRISSRPSLPNISLAHIGTPTSTSHGTIVNNTLVQFTWQWIPCHRYLWVWFRVQVPSFWRHLTAGVPLHISVVAYCLSGELHERPRWFDLPGWIARTATHPQAKVKREESLRASSPQRLNFSRRRAYRGHWKTIRKTLSCNQDSVFFFCLSDKVFVSLSIDLQ